MKSNASDASRVAKFQQYRYRIGRMKFEVPREGMDPFASLPAKPSTQTWNEFTKILPEEVLKRELLRSEQEEKKQSRNNLKKYLKIAVFFAIVLLLTIFIVIAIILINQ